MKFLTPWFAYNRSSRYNFSVIQETVLYNCSHLRSHQNYGFITIMPRKGKKGLRTSDLELLSRCPTFIFAAPFPLGDSLPLSVGFCPS